MAVVELRQYTLVPGRRDTLIDLFEAQLVVPQEQLGMEVIGTFRDLDDDQRFVWIRRFPDMVRRASALAAFYGGPVWGQHRDAANATMVDSDNVLLLRAAWEGSGFDLGPQATSRSLAPGVVQVGIASFRHPVDDAALRYFSDEIEPLLEQAGARMLACLITEHSVNTFPALPVREGENVLTWFAGFPSFQAAAAGRESTSLERAVRGWPGMTGLPEIRLLAPTGWSRLTGNSGTGFASLRLSRSPA